MMKVGILTYHYSHNFGAMIQAYALRKAIIDIVKDDKIFVDIINYIPPTFRNEGENLVDELYQKKKNNRKEFLRNECGIEGEPSSDIHLFNDYDIYITGSDQVWNPNLPVPEKSSEYFLDFVDEGKVRASYAASIGVNITTNFSIDLFKENIPKFDYLSVREQSYCGFIERFTEKECKAVLDPTFLLNPQSYIDLMPYKKKEKGYTLCVAYALKAKRKLYDLVNRYTIVHKQNVVSMEQVVSPYYFMNQEESIFYSSIGEILWYIYNADMIFTDSFHFVVFSIIFHKQFYVILTGKSSRIIDLLTYIGLENRILNDNAKPSLLNEDIDYTQVDKKIFEKKSISIEFLKMIIGKEDEMD